MSFHTRLLLLFCALALVASAQPVEVFGGYTLGKMKGEPDSNRSTMTGWNTSVTGYATSRFGLTADVAGFYGELAANGAEPVSARLYSFTVGPQVRLFRRARFETSVRALFGAAHGHVPSSTHPGLDETTFAANIGSNFDIKVSRRVSLRFSPGMYITQFGDNQTQKNFRFSVGPVFKFGSGD